MSIKRANLLRASHTKVLKKKRFRFKRRRHLRAGGVFVIIFYFFIFFYIELAYNKKENWFIILLYPYKQDVRIRSSGSLAF